jgi:hypothetical protein
MFYFTTPSLSWLYTVEWQNDWWIVKDMEGSRHVLIVLQSRHLPGRTEKKHEKSQSEQPVSLSLERAPPEHNSRVLPLH